MFLALKKLCGVVVLALACSPAAAAPNFVIILADDLGYGDLSCYGNTAYSTPHLDQMSSEGVRLTQFYVASPACSPSRAALLTGMYPQRAGVQAVLNPRSRMGLPPERLTLPELLKQNGYRTAMVGKWHLGHRPEFLPTRQGFDSYFGIPYSNDMKPAPLMRGEKIIEQTVDQTVLTRRYTEEALGVLDALSTGSEPFFLYLAHNFPHVPLFASPEFTGKSGAGLYGDVVQELDWSVGQVLKKLRETGLDKNTLVLFLSDNGPWLIMGDHAGSAGPLRDGKGTAYEGGSRVPFLAWWPGRLKAAQVVDSPIIATDVMPTLANLAGISIPSDHIDGQDAWPVITGNEQTPSDRAMVLVDYYAGRQQAGAIRQGDWKYITPLAKGTKMKYAKVSTRETTGPQLFDISKDPGERNNLAQAHPDKVEAMQKLSEEARTYLEQDDPWPAETETRTTESLDYVTPGTSLYLGH